MSVAALAKAAPGFDFKAYLTAADVGSADRVIVGANTAFPKVAAIFAGTPLSTLKAWQAFHVVDAASPYLSDRFVQARFAFRNHTLAGQPQIQPRWKRAVGFVNRALGEAVGRMYVAQYFTPEAKAKMDALVGNLKVALAARIERVDWMSPQTKAKALEKLAKFEGQDRLSGQMARLFRPEHHRRRPLWRRRARRGLRVGAPGAPAERSGRQAEWGMTPQTVNAYYNADQQRDRLPGRHPAAAVLRSGRRSGDQLRRHRRGDRPRDDPRLRRPGPQVRRRRACCATGGPPTTPPSSRPRPSGSARSTQPSRRARRPRQGRTDHGREHRRPRRGAAGAGRLPRLAARQAGAGDRRPDRRPAGVPRLGPGLAREDPRRRGQAAARCPIPTRRPTSGSTGRCATSTPGMPPSTSSPAIRSMSRRIGACGFGEPPPSQRGRRCR